MDKKEVTPKERIALGECVSPLTTDRCPYCIDVCDAFRWKIKVDKLIENISKP